MDYLLFRVQFDNELLLNVLRDIGTLGSVEILAAERILVPLKPRILAVVETSKCVVNDLEGLRTLAYADNLTRLYAIGSDIDNLAIDNHMLVEHELTCGGTGRSDTQTVNDIIETALKQLEQYLTGYALGALGLLEETTELRFKDTIGIFSLLLFLKLSAILRSFLTTIQAMLTRGIVLLSENLVWSVNSLAKFAGNAGFRSSISCHSFFTI